ncbi:MAG: SOS response-associated peptidase [Rhodobacteraceae bacterium]|nr:SOS response-associated peptidase [Paracoccaceae bacterium]
MCGRFALLLPADAVAQLFDAAPDNDLPEVPNFNICPTNRIHAVVAGEGARRLVAMRWGFVPKWYESPADGPLLINARAETVAARPAFRAAAQKRRCLIPATGFYEWTRDTDGKRLPWYMRHADDSPIAFAGIWQVWDRGGEPMTTCAIVTAQSSGPVGGIHPRMPVSVARRDWPLWLGEAGKGAALLLRDPPGEVFAARRVGVEVNSNRASGRQLIEPVMG